ncbi:MAG: hypothetical protein ACOYN2_06320 [Patescibacteria group bacterium]
MYFGALGGLGLTLPIPTGAILNNELYTVRVTIDTTQVTPTSKLEIIGPGITNAVMSGSGDLSGARGITKVYIGGKLYGSQWNDLIDYFRISQL